MNSRDLGLFTLLGFILALSVNPINAFGQSQEFVYTEAPFPSAHASTLMAKLFVFFDRLATTDHSLPSHTALSGIKNSAIK